VYRFESHADAASWYQRQNQPVPSNCFVEGNPPEPFEFTNGDPPDEVKQRGENDPVRVIRLWDATYRQRIGKWPVFLATETEFLELNQPPRVSEAQMRRIFGRIPATLNPPEIARDQLDSLVRLATAR
jgi:hypothetical protein